MATLPRPQLFCWDSVDQLGDLQRLRLVLDALPDEPLMQILEAERGNGRDDYPVRPMWNSLIAAFVFGHPSIAALRRELLRNLQLRHLCGFDVFKGLEAVPSECAYTRFQRRLFDHEQEVGQIFHDAADLVQEVLPDFGQELAIDGEELHSQANGPPTYADDDDSQEHRDRRREQDADWGVKGRTSKHSWFGFLLHLVVDTTYELPVAFEVTEASAAEQPQALRLLDQLEQRHPTVLERCGHLSADKGYDDGKLIIRLWDQHQIKPGHRHSQLLARRGEQQGGRGADERHLHLRRRGLLRLSQDRDRTQHELRRLRARSRHPEVPLSGARDGRRVQGDAAVSGGHGGAHTAQRGPAGVHPGGALQLRLEGALRPAQRRGAGQQPPGRLVRVRRPVHPWAGQDAAALHAGAVDHAGDGARTHRSRPARTPNTCAVSPRQPEHAAQRRRTGADRTDDGGGGSYASQAARRSSCSTAVRSPIVPVPSRTSRLEPCPAPSPCRQTVLRPR